MTKFGVYNNLTYNTTMSNLEKALLTVDGEHVDITVPFTKANQEKRTIIGIATADAVDHAGDVVTWAASKKAFETTNASIREQHQKNKTVGKIVGFEAKSVYDPETKKVINVIEVEAYISRTAEDTWTKINEGILKGFSIGGNVAKSEERVSKSDPTKTHRYITDYTLTELSVVDNPCSPQAKIITINKSMNEVTGNEETILKGMATEVETENVFWNATTRELKVTKDAELEGFEYAGWIETSKSLDDEARSEQLAAVLEAHLDLAKSYEGGVTNMSEKQEVTTEETVEEVPTETVEETTETVVEEPVVEEVSSEGTDIQKMIDELRDFRSTIAETVEKAVNQASEDTVASLTEVQTKFEKASDSLNTELTALSEKYEELSKSVTNLSDKFESIEKSIDALEADTAIKKSGDLGGSTEIKKNKESMWANSALSLRDL